MQDRLRSAEPWVISSLSSEAFDDSHKSKEELDRIWDFVDLISSRAASCHDHGRDENAWCEKVVSPLMQTAVAVKRSIFEVDSMYDYCFDER